MDEAKIAGRAPIAVEVVAGRDYGWCRCGLSGRQPFCDGSHRGSAFEPLQYRAEKDGKVWFCGCRRTGGEPLCDGSHSRLPPD